MVVYIQKRLNIFVCMPSGAGAEGEGWVYGEPATVSDMPHQAPPYVQFLATPLGVRHTPHPNGAQRTLNFVTFYLHPNGLT